MAKTDFTMVETPKNTQSKIVIRPYFDARSEKLMELIDI
jgi:hypothetical protein